MGGELVTLFLAGDVMLGRGVDQILPHPGDPALPEAYVTDARTYVELAEAANGTIARPVAFSWPWGEALAVLDAAAPDARIVNLETSVTQSDDVAPRKSIHYRMHPANLPCLAAARPAVCALANNHVLDYGRRGLAETLDSLAAAGLRAAGRAATSTRRGSPRPSPFPGPDTGVCWSSPWARRRAESPTRGPPPRTVAESTSATRPRRRPRPR